MVLAAAENSAQSVPAAELHRAPSKESRHMVHLPGRSAQHLGTLARGHQELDSQVGGLFAIDFSILQGSTVAPG